MDLEVKDVADLLSVSEEKIHNWLDEGKIPAYQINKQYRFSRIEVEEWVMRHKLDDAEEACQGKSGFNQFALFRALHKGSVLHKVPGTTKQEVIRATMETMADDLKRDAEVLTELLLDRERLQPTSLNNGFAVPHTRDFLFNDQFDVVTIAFLDQPIDYGALDGKPVDTLFFLFAGDDKRHLHLLAKIAHLVGQEEPCAFLQTKPNKAALLKYLQTWEKQV